MHKERVVGTEPIIQPTSVQATATVLTAGGGTWAAAEPAPSGTPCAFNGVSVAAPAEVWAAGQTQSAPLIERWNGTEWNIVACPEPDAHITAAGLHGIAVTAGTGIAVGGGYDPRIGRDLPLIRHWDGRDWTGAEPPDLGGPYVLTDVVLVSADAAWAVGHGLPRSDGAHCAVILRWDGSSWAAVGMPEPVTGSLMALATTSDEDVWAAGEDGDRRPCLLHFDGSGWRAVPAPSSAARRGLTGVAARSADDAWAVGPDSVLHWDGAEWSATQADGLTGAATVVAAGSDVWIAGGAGRLARFDGERWQRPAARTDTVWTGSAAGADGEIWLVGAHRLVHEPPASGRP